MKSNLRKILVWLMVAIIMTIMVSIVGKVLLSTKFRMYDNSLIEIGLFIIASFTLIALIFYANDTNRLASIAQLKWENETILDATYEMQANEDVKNNGIIYFRLYNHTRLVIYVEVIAIFYLYGKKFDLGDAYNGTKVWPLHPKQMSQSWYDLNYILKSQDKTIEQMESEYTHENRLNQLTCNLTVTFIHEKKLYERVIPERTYYFNFNTFKWIPDIAIEKDKVWGNA